MNISASQARWFRFRRSGLEEPFATPAETARCLIGVQAQLPAAAEVAFFNRTVGVSPDSLAHERLETRSVLRMWGQRNTAHVYAADDWPLLHTAFRRRESVMAGRLRDAGLGDAFQRVIDHLEKRLAGGEHLTYKDVGSSDDHQELIDGLDKSADKWADLTTTNSGAGWLLSHAVFFRLVRAGIICHGPDQGAESTFVHRQRWLPDLQWTLPDDSDAFAELACRYLATYGPATSRNLASWFGITAAEARQWLAAAGERITQVEVDGQTTLLCIDDIDALAETAPAPGKWPVRLLYRFDPYVLAAIGAKDKQWLIDKSRYKDVWRPGAHINAVVLVGGRIAGTWRYDKKAKGLVIRVTPFKPLSRAATRSVASQAKAIATFMGLELLELTDSAVR